jgi:sugar-specific transcriptional regulator TrmB
MSIKTDSLKNLLKPFGLDEDESHIYSILAEEGLLTALQVSRKSKISRTKVYRILDKLAGLGLVSQSVDEMGAKFMVGSPKEFEKLVIERQHEVDIMKEKMPIIFEQLEALQFSGNNKDSRILYYKGLEGLKQITWNSLKAKDELLTMEIKDMDAFLDHGFAEKMREELVKRKIKSKTITNQSHIDAWTNVKEITTKDFWEIKYINPNALEIKFEVLIYNDVYCMYSYEDNEIFCVEIYNEKLAKMQKQIFQFMWVNARPFVVLDSHGSAKLI